MDAFESDWQKVTWGGNYDRLKAVKERYDPRGLFWCRHCVGSEKWEEDDQGRLRRPTGLAGETGAARGETPVEARYDEL